MARRPFARPRRGTLELGSTGFEPAYASDRPGAQLLMRPIQDLCAGQSVQTLDFGPEDAVDRHKLGDERLARGQAA
jgi:hypothetical protein